MAKLSELELPVKPWQIVFAIATIKDNISVAPISSKRF